MSLEHDVGQIRTCICVYSSLCILTTIPWVCQALVLLVFVIHGHSHRLELLCQFDCGVAPVAWLWSKTGLAWTHSATLAATVLRFIYLGKEIHTQETHSIGPADITENIKVSATLGLLNGN